MTIYAVGGEADCFEPVSGQDYAHTTTSGRFNSNASRGAMVVVEGESELILTLPATVTDLWLHAVVYQESVSAGDYIIFETDSGDPVYKVLLTATGQWTLSRYESAAWVDMFTTTNPVLVNTLGTIDLHLVRHSSTGEATLYLDKEEVGTFSGNTITDESGISQIHFVGLSTGSAMNLSQVIVADVTTVDMALVTRPPTGNGAHTDWDGTYADVDEFIYNPSDAIRTDVAESVETFTGEAIPSAFNAYRVLGVAVALRGENDPTSVIDDLQTVVRVGSTDYNSPDLAFPKDGESHSIQTILEVNPATSNPWSRQEVGESQFGVESVEV